MPDLSFTHIHEAVRAHFGISRDEYALCSYVQTWAANPKNQYPGWCNRTQKEVALWVGITDRGLRKMLIKMQALGLVERDSTSGKCRITEFWFEAVMLAKAEQSSSIDRNKVPQEAEQSSSIDRNKVPRNIKSIIINNSDTETLSGKPDVPPKTEKEKIDIVVSRLNEVCGTRYQADRPKTVSAIKARLKEGRNYADFDAIIRYKYLQWGNDPKFREYLRPDTLFNGHFEDYLEAARLAKESPITEKAEKSRGAIPSGVKTYGS